VATVLANELKRQVTVDGVDYTIAVDPDGFGELVPDDKTEHLRKRLHGVAAKVA